jgi:hypothetical protein
LNLYFSLISFSEIKDLGSPSKETLIYLSFLMLEATEQYKLWKNGEKIELDGERRLTRCFDRQTDKRTDRQVQSKWEGIAWLIGSSFKCYTKK